jgi:hypothetical protein
MPTIDSPASDPGKLFEGSFTGTAAFAQLVRDALAHAAREGWNEMVWSDANFEDWPLREKAVIDSLNAWSRRGRKLLLLAKTFDSVQRYQARMVTWRTTWDHIVECRVCKAIDAADFPSALWSPHWVMRRLDLARSTGIAGCEPQRRVFLKEELEECKRRSSPGFSATILGL